MGRAVALAVGTMLWFLLEYMLAVRRRRQPSRAEKLRVLIALFVCCYFGALWPVWFVCPTGPPWPARVIALVIACTGGLAGWWGYQVVVGATVAGKGRGDDR